MQADIQVSEWGSSGVIGDIGPSSGVEQELEYRALGAVGEGGHGRLFLDDGTRCRTSRHEASFRLACRVFCLRTRCVRSLNFRLSCFHLRSSLLQLIVSIGDEPL